MKKLSLDELGRISVDAFRLADKTPIMIVLDNIRSMHNIGSVFRTSDAFLLEGIYLCGITATPPNNEIHKTALGATDSVAWKYFERTTDALIELKLMGYCLVAIEQTDESVFLQEFTPQPGLKYALVFGNEVKGVEENALEFCDLSLEIPQDGTKHSLNVSVCAGIVIWEFFTKIRMLKH